MKTIYFAGLRSESNLGDVVISACTEELYKDSLQQRGLFSFRHLNLQFAKLSITYRVFRKARRLLFKLLKRNHIKSEIAELKIYYKNQLEYADLIVVVGGGLIKYKYQDFHIFLAALIEVAEALNIPIVINAVGIEGYDESDVRCQILKKALNRSIVKSITTRDDLATLEKCYIDSERGRASVAKVADPAVYTNEVYRQQKKQSTVYGIGLVRGGIFLDNGKNVSPKRLAKFYAEIIKEMESRGIVYQLFTNGLPSDVELLPLIKDQLNRQDLNVIEPETDNALVETIASFTTVIAARLHANIIAYALNIPSIGLVWNDKLALFGADIGHPERFFSHGQFNAKYIVDAAVQANDAGYEEDRWLSYKLTAKSNIENIVSLWLTDQL